MCRISVSRFYRDAVVFNHLRDQVLPALARAARHRGAHPLAVWSAGCAAGEEPYTLLLAWRFAVAPQVPGVDLRIVATDADAHALERARAGCYRPSSMKKMPRAWLEAFKPGDGRLSLDAGLRQQVEFRQHDLREAPPDGPFDLVLCRNLLFTYFEEPLRTQTVEQEIESLAPGGVLVTGAREGWITCGGTSSGRPVRPRGVSSHGLETADGPAVKGAKKRDPGARCVQRRG